MSNLRNPQQSLQYCTKYATFDIQLLSTFDIAVRENTQVLLLLLLERLVLATRLCALREHAVMTF